MNNIILANRLTNNASRLIQKEIKQLNNYNIAAITCIVA